MEHPVDQDSSPSARLDEFFGDRDFTAYAEARRRFTPLCVCGHVSIAHGPSIGGTFEVEERNQKTRPDGSSYWQETRLDGCRGELRSGRFEPTSTFRDGDTAVTQVNPTCACREFRPVAEVDRPGRYFNQRRPADRSDITRHPLPTGMRAYRTRISRFKSIDGDPDLTAQEFDRRFRFLDTWFCATCGLTEDVWPVFVDPVDHSELRCPAHR